MLKDMLKTVAWAGNETTGRQHFRRAPKSGFSPGWWLNPGLKPDFGVRRNCCLLGSFVSRPCNSF